MVKIQGNFEKGNVSAKGDTISVFSEEEKGGETLHDRKEGGSVTQLPSESLKSGKKIGGADSYHDFLHTFQSENKNLENFFLKPNNTSFINLEKKTSDQKVNSSDYHTKITDCLSGLVSINQKLKVLVSNLHEELLASGGEIDESTLEYLVSPLSLLNAPSYVTEKYHNSNKSKYLDTSGESTVVSTPSFVTNELKKVSEMDATREIQTKSDKEKNPFLLVNAKTGFTRVLRACKKCHERKIACSGARPCEPCIKNGTNCEEYISTKKRRSRRKSGHMLGEQFDSKRQKNMGGHPSGRYNLDNLPSNEWNMTKAMNVAADQNAIIREPPMRSYIQHIHQQPLPTANNVAKAQYTLSSRFDNVPYAVNDQNVLIVDPRMQPLDSSGGSNISYELANYQTSSNYLLNPLYFGYAKNVDSPSITFRNPSEISETSNQVLQESDKC